jgi:Zn-dependent protease with chaperone function
MILGPLAASIIQPVISRNREFQADAAGAPAARARGPDPAPVTSLTPAHI